MVLSHRYFFYTLIGLFILIPSIHAQEQLTNFKGAPCCYSFEKIIPHGGINYGLARDHQDGVRIYLLNKTEANLVFSNDQDDKITLINHGLLEEFYYFIYQDRIELFRFSDGALDVYEFDEPLNLNRSRKEALSMSKYGLTLIPESETEALRFYNFASQRFETRSPSLNREHTRFQIDSFILYYQFEEGQGRLASHNMLTDEIHSLYSVDNQKISFLFQNGMLFYSDRDSLFITNGSPQANFLLSDSRIYMGSILSYRKGKDMHFLFRIQNNLSKYFKIDWDSGTLEDYAVSTHSLSSRVRSFYRINQEELFLFDRNNFLKFNIQNGSASVTEQRWASNLYFDTANVYYEDISLKSFNYAKEEVTELSEINISNYIQDIREIYKVNDSFFYFIAHNEGLFEDEGLDELFAFDLISDTIIEMLSYGQNGNGLGEAKLQKLGGKLVLRTEDQIFEWTGQDFEPVFTTGPKLPIVQHQNKYYFSNYSYVGNGTVILYEWKDQEEIVASVRNIPSYYLENILSTPDQLIFMNRYMGGISVDTEAGNYDTLSPYDQEVLVSDFYPVDNYIIKALRVVGRGDEYWSYNIETKSWTQLQTDHIQRPENIAVNPNQAGDFLLNLEYSNPGTSLKSISMLTGESEILLDENSLGSDYHLDVEISCGETAIVHASNYDRQDQKLFITDGTKDGTREILDLDPSRYFVSFYKFEGDIYFTAIDEDYTKVFRFNCENQLIREVPELDPLIPQQHFSLNDQTYTLGYQLLPNQNLTLIKITDTRAEELRVSPYEVAPDRLSSYRTVDSKPIIYFSDSLLAIAVSLDEKGEELWSVGLYGQLERMTDLNQGPFDSEIDNLVAFGDYLYFTGYKYGVGKQVWRMPFPNTYFNTDHNNLELLIAPNPTDQFLTIYDMPLEKGKIFIFDMSGKPVFEGIKNEGTPQFSHNMQPYPPGMYIVVLRINGKQYSGKLILK